MTRSGDRRKSIVAEGYDAMADTYATWAAGIKDDPRDRMIAALSEWVPARGRVLDLGCGSGLPSTKVLAERFDVVGVDVSKAQVERARANVPGATFIVGDLTSVEFPAGSFDAVTAFYSLNHVPREEHPPLFERVAQWLVEGGWFLATFGLADEADWIGEWLGVPMYFSSHDRDTTRRLLRVAGFELEINEVASTKEPEGEVSFLWVLARVRRRRIETRTDPASAESTQGHGAVHEVESLDRPRARTTEGLRCVDCLPPCWRACC